MQIWNELFGCISCTTCVIFLTKAEQTLCNIVLYKVAYVKCGINNERR